MWSFCSYTSNLWMPCCIQKPIEPHLLLSLSYSKQKSYAGPLHTAGCFPQSKRLEIPGQVRLTNMTKGLLSRLLLYRLWPTFFQINTYFFFFIFIFYLVWDNHHHTVPEFYNVSTIMMLALYGFVKKTVAEFSQTTFEFLLSCKSPLLFHTGNNSLNISNITKLLGLIPQIIWHFLGIWGNSNNHSPISYSDWGWWGLKSKISIGHQVIFASGNN